MDSEARVNVYLNSCCKLLQGYRKVNSQVVNEMNKIDVNNSEWPFAGKACKEKEVPNSWVSEMAKELKLIEQDEVL